MGCQATQNSFIPDAHYVVDFAKTFVDMHMFAPKQHATPAQVM